MHTREYYSAVKRNIFESIPNEVNEPRTVIQSGKSEEEDTLMHIYGI